MKFYKLVVDDVCSLELTRELDPLLLASQVYWQYWRYPIDSAVEWPVDRVRVWTVTAIHQGAGSTQ